MRFALLALAVMAGRGQDDVVKKIVPDAEKVKKLARRLPAGAREKIEKALGEKLAEAELATPLWECYTTVPAVSSMEKTRCVVCVVTVRGPKGVIKLGVAAATIEKALRAVRILENGDDKGIESKHFISQFEDFEYTDNVYNAPAVLSDQLKKAQGTDDAAKEMDCLVRMNLLMLSMGPAWERMAEKIDKKDKTAADDVAFMDQAVDDALKLIPAAKFLRATSHDRFKQYAAGAKSDFAEMKNLLAAGRFDDAYRKSGEIDSQRCAKCHGSYRQQFRTARFDRNLGNGYFSVKLDVGVPDPKSEPSFQAVATGVKKAVLLATEMK
jgi:hypothetical protein